MRVHETACGVESVWTTLWKCSSTLDLIWLTRRHQETQLVRRPSSSGDTARQLPSSSGDTAHGETLIFGKNNRRGRSSSGVRNTSYRETELIGRHSSAGNLANEETQVMKRSSSWGNLVHQETQINRRRSLIRIPSSSGDTAHGWRQLTRRQQLFRRHSSLGDTAR
jgi:hypothetical protein